MFASTISHIKELLITDMNKTQEKYDYYMNLLHQNYGGHTPSLVASQSELKDLESYRQAMIVSRNAYEDFCNHQF